jgi:hypothetical protein
MRPPLASSTTTPAANPPEAPNDAATTAEDDEEVEEVFHIRIPGVIICTLIADLRLCFVASRTHGGNKKI